MILKHNFVFLNQIIFQHNLVYILNWVLLYNHCTIVGCTKYAGECVTTSENTRKYIPRQLHIMISSKQKTKFQGFQKLIPADREQSKQIPSEFLFCIGEKKRFVGYCVCKTERDLRLTVNKGPGCPWAGFHLANGRHGCRTLGSYTCTPPFCK